MNKPDINILSYAQLDKSGFLRIGAELPPGNTKHFVSISGITDSNNFLAFDNIYVCSSIFIDVNPKVIFIDNDFSDPVNIKQTISAEKLEVRFITKDFTPTNIYAALNILKGDTTFHKLNYPEFKITDFSLKNNNNFMEFSFEFPQNDKKLSDYINISEIEKSFTPSLVIVLEFKKDNYSVNNQDQLNEENLINNFAFPLKLISYKDIGSLILTEVDDPYKFNLVTFDEFGDENIDGLVSCKLDLCFSPYYFYYNEIGEFPQSVLYNSNTGFTEMRFPAQNFFVEIINYFKNQTSNAYDYNDSYNILKNGTFAIINKYDYNKNIYYSIERSKKENDLLWIFVRGNIVDEINNKENNLIVCLFLPTHYRIKSDRDYVSDIFPLKLSNNAPVIGTGYNKNNFKYETISISGNILDNRNLYIELIDDINNTSITRKIKIDRTKITTKLTSNVNDGFYVSTSFFKNYSKVKFVYNISGDSDVVKRVFWNPIIPSYDGFIGISKNLNEFYIKLISNYSIQNVTGYISCLNVVSLRATSILGISLTNENEDLDFDLNNNVLINDKEAYIRINMSDLIKRNIVENNVYITANISVQNTDGATYTVEI